MAIARAIVADPQRAGGRRADGRPRRQERPRGPGPPGEPQPGVREDDRDGHPRPAGRRACRLVPPPREGRPRRSGPELVQGRAHEVPAFRPEAPAPQLDPHDEHGRWRWSSASSSSARFRPIIVAVNWELRSANASRLVVRNAVSLFYSLPLTYKDKIRAVPGVKNVATASFWLLAFGDSADFFKHPAYAVDAGAVPRDLPRVHPVARGEAGLPRRPPGLHRWPRHREGVRLEGRRRHPARGPDGQPSALRLRRQRDLPGRQRPPPWHGRPDPLLPPQVPRGGVPAPRRRRLPRRRDRGSEQGGIGRRVDRPDVRGQRTADPHGDRVGLPSRHGVDGRQSGAHPPPHRHRGDLHDPGRHRQHDEHGGAPDGARKSPCSRRSVSAAGS